MHLKSSSSGEVANEGLYVLRRFTGHKGAYLAKLAEFDLGAKI